MNVGKVLLRVMFLLLFLFIAYYVFFIETEKYQSRSIVMIKDVSQEQTVSPFGALLSNVGSESMRDAKLLEVYLKSNDMYDILEREFNLSSYYTSDTIDFFHRLSNNSIFLSSKINKKNFLAQYNEDLLIRYDEPSATIKVAFAYADATVAQKIVERMIAQSSIALNRFEKQNTEVVLAFLKKQEREKYDFFITSLKKLLDYQTQHNTIDPKVDIESKNTILAGLESELVQKEVNYNSKLQYLNSSSSEMRLLQGNIQFIKKSIEQIKNQIIGNTGQKELHVDMSDFELLKNRVEFDKELYRQTLAKLEETKVLVQQNTKNLIVISKAQIADSYTYPNKIKDIFSIFIVLFFLYGIATLVFNIIKDHKD